MTQQFLNCPMAYECPKDWFELTPINKVGVKHCDTCNQEVYLCLEQDELTERITESVCVAYFIEPDRQTHFTLAREKVEANKRNPNFKPRMMMGIPSGATPRILKDEI